MSLDNYIENALTREVQFAAFVNGPLLDFWQQREEAEFIGIDKIPIRYVKFRAPQHTRVVVLVSGRTEHYAKYSEVAYDFFQQGYDVMLMDHRGQGKSGRMLADPQRGHVVNFDDYVDDFAQLIQREMTSAHYLHRYALGQSMGGAILMRFLAKVPHVFDAAALCSPMLGIYLPIPFWLAHSIIDWAERYPAIREDYAIGTGKWRPRPFRANRLTHSRVRYERIVRQYADSPMLQLGGPTYHWLRESLLVGQKIIAEAEKIITPLLLLQASDERVVANASQNAFSLAMMQAGHPCEGGAPQIIQGARHEILFEQDKQRTEALSILLHFFAQHSQLGDHIDANSTEVKNRPLCTMLSLPI